jgi:hypothetical protein
MEHRAAQLLLAAGRHGAGILERHSGEGRDEANHNSRLSEEGIVERRWGRSLFHLLCRKRWRRHGVVERCWCSRALRGLSSPIPGRVVAPLPHPFDVGGAAEVRAVVGCTQPTTLTGRFAGLAAEGLKTGVLASNIARVRSKAALARLTRALVGVRSHWPGSPPAHHRPRAAWKEENHEENGGERRGKKREER